MCSKNPVGMAACILVIVGALNWGFVGLGKLLDNSDWNLVTMLVGRWTIVEAVVYILVGLAGIYKLVMCSKKCCGTGDSCKC